MRNLLNPGSLIKLAVIGIAVYFITRMIKTKQSTNGASDEINSLLERNKQVNKKPTSAHIAVANSIHENFNHAIVTNARENRIIALFEGDKGNVRSIEDMRLIYQAYGVRTLPNRVDFDIFGVGFSSGTLMQHTEAIFDSDRKSTKGFISVLEKILAM